MPLAPQVDVDGKCMEETRLTSLLRPVLLFLSLDHTQ